MPLPEANPGPLRVGFLDFLSNPTQDNGQTGFVPFLAIVKRMPERLALAAPSGGVVDMRTGSWLASSERPVPHCQGLAVGVAAGVVCATAGGCGRAGGIYAGNAVDGKGNGVTAVDADGDKQDKQASRVGCRQGGKT